MITRGQLLSIMPLASRARADEFLPHLNAAMEEFDIDTHERQSAFLAQAAHESAQLRALVENLNYSAAGLLQTWHRRFTAAEAEDYARHPERIANHVYALRMGNGDEASGDGWLFRGRGIFQVTGRGNYAVCSNDLYGDDRLLESPELLEQPEGACRSAGWFWKSRELNKWADSGDFKTLTLRINGGLNGWQERNAYLARANAALEAA